ncbi:hypothetical protein BG000_007144 [Podila horticola]|nr:hypothetical protein BG000_007144 [Podila horticola]
MTTLMRSRSSTEQYRDQPTNFSSQISGLVHITPHIFQFSASKVSTGQVAKVKLKNTSSTPVGYKFKTNAPQKYSVRPVFGVMMPGDSVKVFVRSEGWINPQDRFLLQSIALGDEEGQTFQAATRPTVSIGAPIPVRRVSNATNPSTCSSVASSPGTYPTLFAYNSKSTTSAAPPSPVSVTSSSSIPQALPTVKQQHVRDNRNSRRDAERMETAMEYPGSGPGFAIMVETGLEGLGISREHVHAMTKRWSNTRQYVSLTQLIVVSFICLLLGVVLPASIRSMVKN